MGNAGSTSPPSLGKAHFPHLEWKIHDFSALLKTGTKSAKSSYLHCSGYKWFLQVTPSTSKRTGVETPYVGLCLKLCWSSLEPGDTVNAAFELSVYNHSKRIYCGYKASHNFDLENTLSKNEFTSPQKKDVVVHKKASTIQNLFIQKKGFIEGTYTWTMDNYLELNTKNLVFSPTFEVGGHKWCIGMYPHGDRHITDCVSLYLFLNASDELSAESGMAVELTLSILNQKNGKHFSMTTGLFVLPGASGWGWPWFLSLKKFKDPLGGCLVGSRCVVKADFTIVGSSNVG
ncbi:hypothetical protein ACQ4PT_071124 [Festuca glaucescens]